MTEVTSRTTIVLVSTIVAVRTFFKCFLKDWSVAAVTTCSGKEFQMRGAAAGKARLLTVDSLTDGTTKRLVIADRRAQRLGRATTEVSGPRYRGAI